MTAVRHARHGAWPMPGDRVRISPSRRPDYGGMAGVVDCLEDERFAALPEEEYGNAAWYRILLDAPAGPTRIIADAFRKSELEPI